MSPVPDTIALVAPPGAALTATAPEIAPRIVGRNTTATVRLPGATLQPWLDAHLDDVTPLDEQVERLITAPYGHIEGPIAHALACGAHLAVLDAAPWNTLDGRYHDYVAEVRSLRDWWGVPDPPGWRTTMAGLIGDGYALTPGNLALMLRLRFAAEHGLPGGELDPVVWAELADQWCEENDAAGVFVAEERERVVGLLLEVAEGHDVPVGLYGVEDPVRTRVRLDQPVRAETLVDPERVERGRVEAGQEHVDDDREVDLAVPESQREVFVVVLKAVR